jgi:WD40 repeat protein
VPNRTKRRLQWQVVCRLLTLAVLCAPAVAPAASPITCVVFAPGRDEAQHVLVGSQAALELRSWPELELIRSLPAPWDHVHDLAFSPDGAQLAVAGGSPGDRGGAVRLSWPHGETLETHRGHDDVAYRVAWSSDGNRLLTAGADQRIAVTALPSSLTTTLSGHSKPILAVSFFADHFLLSAAADNSLRLWDAENGQLRRTMENHTGPVLALAVRPGDHPGPAIVATASEDGTVRFWQPEIGRLVRFARLESPPLAIAWTPGGQRIAAACRDGHLRLIDADTVSVSFSQRVVEGWPFSIAVSPDGSAALVGGERGQLARCELPASKQ